MLFAGAASAQVTLDGTFGTEGLVSPGVDPEGESADYLIRGDLGEQRGGNLFHSFSTFSIGAGETATFTDQGLAADRPVIQNVISRVTGGSESQIEGTLRSTVDQADVWLLNPAGVVFGEGANLDVPGGFHASTADELSFDSGEELEVRLGGTVPILDIAAPTTFGFLGTNAARLSVRDGAVLSVDGAALALEGAGEVSVAGEVSADAASASANGGSVRIAGETITVERFAQIRANGLTGGDITLHGHDVVVEAIADVDADGASGIGAAGGSVTIEGTGSVTHHGDISANGRRGGAINLRGGVITIDGSLADIDALGDAERGGSVSIEGDETVTMAGDITVDGATGGSVVIRSRVISVPSPAGDISADGSAGAGGSVRLLAEEAVSLGDVSANGRSGGAIEIVGGTLSLERLGDLSVRASGTGQTGGQISLEGEQLRLFGQISAEAARGNPGTITLQGEIETVGGVVRDGSLGDAPAGVIPAGVEGGLLSHYLITPELGRLVGDNLFHSLSRLDLASREIATFTGDESVEHIVARVTGGDASEIFGTLRSTAPSADLYLLNPAGVVFGPGGTSLSLVSAPGSFRVSTADRLAFGDSGEAFEARLDGAVPTLETAMPGAFGFLDTNTASIAVTSGTRLAVSGGATLALEAAGAVTVDGSVTANGPSGGGVILRGETVTVGVAADVEANGSSGAGGTVLVEGSEAVTLGRASDVVAEGASGGGITVRGRSVRMEEASEVQANGRAALGGSVHVEGEEIALAGAILTNGTGGATGGGGQITIRGRTVTVSPEGGIGARGISGSPAGSIRIEGEELVKLSGDRVVVSAIGTDGGNIELLGRSVVLENGARVFANGGATSDGGSVLLDAEEVSVRSASYIAAEGQDGGTITLRGDAITVDDSLVSTKATTGLEGTGTVAILSNGDILLRASELTARSESGLAGLVEVGCPTEPCQSRLVMRDGAGLTADTFFEFAGRGGSVLVRVGELDLDTASYINVSGFLQGAGSIEIQATRGVRIANTGGGPLDFEDVLTRSVAGVFAASFDAQAGALSIVAPRIVVEEGAVVGTVSVNAAPGTGTIHLEGDEIAIRSGAVIDGSSLLGDGSSISIIGAESVEISGVGPDGPSRVRSLTGGVGRGGSVLVEAPRILLDGGAIATTSLAVEGAGPGGPSGDVVLSGQEIELTGGARIDTSTFSSGTGGTIELTAVESATLEGAGTGVSARTGAEAAGGTVVLDTDRLVLRDGAALSVESRAGLAELGPILEDLLTLAEVALDRIGLAFEPFPDEASGPAGSIEVTATNLLAESGAEISARAPAANGGNVTLLVSDGLHLVDSTISADVGEGDGGNIIIDPVFVVLDSSKLLATAGKGRGGEIRVTTEAFIADPASVIEATSEAGPQFDGVVEINAPDVDLAGSLAQLPSAVLDASAFAAQRCAARRTGETQGSFVVSGRDGAPAGPEGLLPAPLAAGGVESPVPPGVRLADFGASCR